MMFMRATAQAARVLAVGLTLSAAVPSLATAADYPAKPVRIVVGFPPGGSVDIVARLVGQFLAERLGQQFIVDNRPGAGSNIATEAVVNAPPDGYTLLLCGTFNAISASLYTRLGFVFLRDIAPVAPVARAPNIMVVHPSVPATTVPAFIAYAKANPGRINMASTGNGTSTHLSGELFKAMTHVDMVHVPYRGNAPALTDLMGGQVQVLFDSLSTSLEHVKAGRLRALAVTSAGRSPVLPDLPTVGDFVPGYEASAFFGICAPAATPRDIVERLNRETNVALADPRMQARLADLGSVAIPDTPPAAFARLFADETEKWAKVVKLSGAKAD
jgi:tripartite-type tricarboxylate transporter receptor subunit TctC